MFHLVSAAGFGVPRGCPLGHAPLGPRPPRPCPAAPPPPPAPPPPAATSRRAAAPPRPASIWRGGWMKLRYCMPLFTPAPSPRSSAFNSKSPGCPPCQIRYTVPVGFSHVDSTVIAPFSTCHRSMLPSQPFRLLPSNMEVHPVLSAKSIGSGCVKPPPPLPPRPGPPGGGVCCAYAVAAAKSRINPAAIFDEFMTSPFRTI